LAWSEVVLLQATPKSVAMASTAPTAFLVVR
jgi:hypothetical protein